MPGSLVCPLFVWPLSGAFRPGGPQRPQQEGEVRSGQVGRGTKIVVRFEVETSVAIFGIIFEKLSQKRRPSRRSPVTFSGLQ